MPSTSSKMAPGRPGPRRVGPSRSCTTCASTGPARRVAWARLRPPSDAGRSTSPGGGRSRRGRTPSRPRSPRCARRRRRRRRRPPAPRAAAGKDLGAWPSRPRGIALPRRPPRRVQLGAGNHPARTVHPRGADETVAARPGRDAAVHDAPRLQLRGVGDHLDARVGVEVAQRGGGATAGVHDPERVPEPAREVQRGGGRRAGRDGALGGGVALGVHPLVGHELERGGRRAGRVGLAVEAATGLRELARPRARRVHERAACLGEAGRVAVHVRPRI